MPWTCPHCGVENLDDSSISHAIEDGGCGYVRIPSGIVLVSEYSSKELPVRAPVTLGADALRSLKDPEVRFVSKNQFRLEKHRNMGGWVVFNIKYATNPLYHNGNAIPEEGCLLNPGDRLSIKGLHFHLSIRHIA
jgi:hypothetical protein